MADDDDTRNLPAMISSADDNTVGLHRWVAKKSREREARRNALRSALQEPSERSIILRSEAKEKGLVRYFLGQPCSLGHIAERYVKSGDCVVCAIQKHKSWRAANPEKMKAAVAGWVAENPEKIHAYSVAYYAANPEMQRQRAKKWREANPDKLSAQGANRRARDRAAEGFHTAEDIGRIYGAQKGKCACCRKKVGDDYHVDHIQPLSRGGSNWPANLQILCPSCNLRKHAGDPVLFMRRHGFLL